MGLLLIDDSILENDKINSNYFTKRNYIPLNCNLCIISIPYYENSSHCSKHRNCTNYHGS